MIYYTAFLNLNLTYLLLHFKLQTFNIFSIENTFKFHCCHYHKLFAFFVLHFGTNFRHDDIEPSKWFHNKVSHGLTSHFRVHTS